MESAEPIKVAATIRQVTRRPHMADVWIAYLTMTVPCMPASMWPGIRQAY
jgi:hypothetical protein